jgi:hypothetical protein
MASTAVEYSPIFHMPVIAPPPPDTEPAVYYAALSPDINLQATGVENEGLQITLANADFADLYAMTGGFVGFIPSGKPLPTADPGNSPGAGTVILESWAVDIDQLKNLPPEGLPPGVPPMTRVLYLDIEPDDVRAALDPLVRGMKESGLRRAWTSAMSPASKTELEDNYLERLMTGNEFAVFVSGGTKIGRAKRSDPGDPASELGFVLRFLDGTGHNLSPVLHLRGMPSYGGARWDGHPLIGAVSDVSVPVNIYLQFEVWNESSRDYEPLPQGVAVKLAGLTNDTLVPAEYTDAQGCVHFSIPDLQALQAKPDLFFVAQTNGMDHAGHTLPDEWSTKGWKAKDGSPGYYEDFVGTQLGTADSPLVFRIGVDFHVKLQYRDGSSGKDSRASKGIPVTLCAGFNPLTYEKKEIRTDENGEVHGVVFDVEAEDTFYFRVEFEIEDADISLPRAKVVLDNWVSSSYDGDWKAFPDHSETNLGTPDDPLELTCSDKERNVALYFLKILYEFSTFLHHITDGDWKGIPNLVFYRTTVFSELAQLGAAIVDLISSELAQAIEAAARPYSWPKGSVNIPPLWHWERSALVHEISHQIMWEECNYSTLGIAYEATFGELKFRDHNPPLICNPEHALIEGWAEFFEAMFADNTMNTPYNVMDSSGTVSVTKGSKTVKGTNTNWRSYLAGKSFCVQGHSATYTISSVSTVAPQELILSSPYLGKTGVGLFYFIRDSLSLVDDSETPQPLGPPPANRGESVEGEFANGLWAIFQNHVVTTGIATDAHLPESDNGNVLTKARWIQDDGGKERFKKMIWEPLKSLKPLPNPTSTAMIAKIRENNSSTWHALHAELQAFNMAMDPPTIDAIVPTSGAAAGGEEVTIYGTNFVQGMLVFIQYNEATDVSVVSSTELKARTPPGVAGPAAVTVAGRAGEATLPGGYTYV